MSLDGFIAGPNDESGGLHDYFFSPSGDTTKVIEEGFKTTGAIIMGRRSLKEYATVPALIAGLTNYFIFYNDERFHQNQLPNALPLEKFLC
jgi:deoxyhypusine synthase